MKTANFPRSYITESYGKFPYVAGEDDWLISICDPAATPANVKAKFARVLFMDFADVELNTPGQVMTEKAAEKLMEMGAINDEQALEIATFIKEARNQKKNVWVNCHAGMCRSGAIVRLLIELGWEDAKYPGQPQRVPNLLVYDKIRKHFPELSQSWDCVVSRMHPSSLSVGDIIGDQGGHGEIVSIETMEFSKLTLVKVKWDYSGEVEEYEQSLMDFFWYGK